MDQTVFSRVTGRTGLNEKHSRFTEKILLVSKDTFQNYRTQILCRPKQNVSYKDGRQSGHQNPTGLVPRAEVGVFAIFTESVLSLGWQESEVAILVFAFNNTKL